MKLKDVTETTVLIEMTHEERTELSGILNAAFQDFDLLNEGILMCNSEEAGRFCDDMGTIVKEIIKFYEAKAV